MPTSKTRSVDRNAWMEQSFNVQISSLLAQALKENPHQTPHEALLSVEKSLLKNNPYSPPPGNKCPINNLPDKLLAYIFQLGVNSQNEESEDQNGDDDELEWEDIEDGDDPDEEECDTDSTSSEEGTEESDDDDGINDFQVLVSRVCRRWRSLAVASQSMDDSLILHEEMHHTPQF